MLMSTSGVGSTIGLLKVLRDELSTGIPACVPDWYAFSPVTMGKRRIGYEVAYKRKALKRNLPDASVVKPQCIAVLSARKKIGSFATSLCLRRCQKICGPLYAGRQEYVLSISDLSMTGMDDQYFHKDGLGFRSDTHARLAKMAADGRRAML